MNIGAAQPGAAINEMGHYLKVLADLHAAYGLLHLMRLVSADAGVASVGELGSNLRLARHGLTPAAGCGETRLSQGSPTK
jgi:hypothetical protein